MKTHNGNFKVTEEHIVIDNEGNARFKEGVIPEIIDGDFYCNKNNLTSLEGGPKEVKRNFYCSNNNLTSLKGCPEIINGDFYCYDNKLTSLKGGPKEVKGYFICFNNNLTSLEGGPKEVKGDFDCRMNELTSLEGVPKEVGGYIYITNTLNDLKIEKEFIKSFNYINNYWEDLLKFMINNNIDLQEVKSWPKEFIEQQTDDIKNLLICSKTISKFNL